MTEQKQLIISIFETEEGAYGAAKVLKDTGASVDDAMGVLTLDKRGDISTHKVGATSGGVGLAAGSVLALLGPVGLGVGAIGGAVVGKLHHKHLGLTDADSQRLREALIDGGAALGVLAEQREVVPIESLLIDQGGETNTHAYDEAVLREAVEGAA